MASLFGKMSGVGEGEGASLLGKVAGVGVKVASLPGKGWRVVSLCISRGGGVAVTMKLLSSLAESISLAVSCSLKDSCIVVSYKKTEPQTWDRNSVSCMIAMRMLLGTAPVLVSETSTNSERA